MSPVARQAPTERFPIHSRAFSATRRLVLSIHIFTWQSQANASLIRSIHANTRAAPNVHQQMCTTGRPFQRLGGLLSNHPNQNQDDKFSNEKTHCRKVSATFSRSLKCWEFQGKYKNAFLFADRFRKYENSLGTNIQEDVNGEKLTVKKWWIFGADFFTVWCRFFHGLRRFFTIYKGHKR